LFLLPALASSARLAAVFAYFSRVFGVLGAPLGAPAGRQGSAPAGGGAQEPPTPEHTYVFWHFLILPLQRPGPPGLRLVRFRVRFFFFRV